MTGSFYLYRHYDEKDFLRRRTEGHWPVRPRYSGR